MSRTTSSATLTNLAAVIIPVKDQDRMVEFHTDALGLEKGADVPFGDEVEGRWVEVVPRGAETPIALCPPGPDGQAGSSETGISLRTGDIEAYHAQLKERGVEVDDEISQMGEPVLPLFWFRDPESNTLMVVELTE